MIQRIQSVYLALIAILAVLTVLFPLAQFNMGSDLVELTVFGLEGIRAAEFDFPAWGTFVPVAVAVLMASSAMVSFFNYKNRKTQLKINGLGLLFNLGLVLCIFILTGEVSEMTGVQEAYAPGAYFPVAAALLFILSNRAIRADEAKVKAADRLR